MSSDPLAILAALSALPSSSPRPLLGDGPLRIRIPHGSGIGAHAKNRIADPKKKARRKQAAKAKRKNR